MLVELEPVKISGKKTGTPGIVPGKETCTIWRIYTSACSRANSEVRNISLKKNL